MTKAARPDPKIETLRRYGTLNTAPEAVKDDLFQEGDEFFDVRDLVQVKYEMLRRTRLDGWPVARSAKAFGLSRPSFYAALEAFTKGGLAGLIPQKRGPRSAHKLDAQVMQFVMQARTEDPDVPITELLQRIKKRFKRTIHRRSLERALLRQEKKDLPPARRRQPRSPPVPR